jgi:fatty aldehyde-generating acyl-ACP reductase
MFTDLLSLTFNKNFSKRNISFAFLVHPRDTSDIYRKYKFLKILPKKIVDFILIYFWPTYGGRIKISGKGQMDTKWGALIISPLTAKQMLADRDSAAKKVHRATKLAQIYGAKVVGLGALTSVVTDGGDYLQDRMKNIHLTSGNSLTSYISATDTIELIKKHKIQGPVAIIGATGSIGKAISKILAASIPNKLILVGKNPERTEQIKDKIILENIRLDINSVVASTNISSIAEAELLVVTTSATGAVMSEDLIGNTKIIYDLTQPKNTPKHIQEKKDILYVDGGLIRLPENIDIGLDISLPKGIAFACLSETMVLAISEKYNLVSKGDLYIPHVQEIGALATEANFISHAHTTYVQS